MKISSEEYKTKFFEEKGFIRKKCVICGGNFWTLNPQRKTCGDVECEGEYRFIRRIDPDPEWDIHKTIERWTQFFAARGHEVLDYYPVVARWREDIYFTIASIALFQPWVTNGLVDPPANPLVVAQPCIRFGGEFSDIDRIGRTGRHLSSFTMGGQHAFLSKKWTGGYWKERYLELNFEFLTKVLRIPPEELTYKEDWWQGGGNAGPSIETFAYGLEVVNGVFMKYRYVNGNLEPIPIRVLDVGWGLERVAWLMQGTPTIYEATFGPVFLWIKKKLDVWGGDQKLLLNYGRYVGSVRTESQEIFDNSRTNLAKRLGLDIEEFVRIFSRLEATYAILDHVKTVIMAIPDGGIPANIGGAANLRAILRRAVSLAEKNNLDVPWEELIYRTVEYFAKTFHRIKGIESIATDIWHYEMNRFYETIERAVRELKKIIKKRRVKIVGDELLRYFYTNYGIPPEEIEYLSEKLNLGIKVNVSPNFYESIRLMQKEEKAKGIEKVLFEDEIRSLPETKMLFYDDPYAKEFNARVIFARDHYLVFDKTLFYPIGGGQLHDEGVVEINGRRFNIVRVFRVAKVVVHQTAESVDGVEIDAEVYGRINWGRRLALMRHHTATHIINGAAQRVLGPHVWQMGAEKKPEKAHLDISHYKNLSFEELQEIEKLANKIVLENRKINLMFLPRTEAEKRFGVRIYQGGAVPAAVLRIVDIENWDVEACGGTHLTQTILVGPIKIIGAKKIHDGVVRIEFVAGESAVSYIQEYERYLRKACDVLRVQPENLAKVVERFFIDWKRQKDELSKLWKLLIAHIENFVRDRVVNLNGKRFVIARIDLDLGSLIQAVSRISRVYDNILLVSSSLGENLFVATGEESFLGIVKEIVVRLGGEIKASKNKIFGKLKAPADNLLVGVKKALGIRS